MQNSMNYMIDTCIFNFLLDGDYTINDLPTGKYYITHVQRDELDATADEMRRNDLKIQLNVTNSTKVVTSVALSGLAQSGESSCGDTMQFNTILTALDKRKIKKNNQKDAVIGATAIENNFILITGDSDFAEVMKDLYNPENVIYLRK